VGSVYRELEGNDRRELLDFFVGVRKKRKDSQIS